MKKRALKLFLLLTFLVGVESTAAAAETEPVPIIFEKSGGGQFIYCNNKEFITEDWLSTSENPEAKYMMNNENLKPGKYSVFFCFYNWTDFNLEPDIEFKASKDAVITINSVGFYTPQTSEEWDCLGAWSDYLGIDIRPLSRTEQYIHYQGDTKLPATFTLSNSNEWISNYIYNYESINPKVTFNMLVDFTIESGEADVNFAALKSYGELRDRSMHNPNAAFGPYVRDTAIKGIDTETLPVVEADLDIVIDKDTPNGENIPVKVFNQANPDGIKVDYWTSNINPNSDGSVFCRNTAASSDMLSFIYKDDSKYNYYGENIPETERDNIWRMDIFHYDTQWYSNTMPWKASDHVPNAFTSKERPISEVLQTELEFNLGNFGVTNRHNLTITNNDTVTRTLNYFIDSARSSDIVIVRDENGVMLNPYTHKPENAFALSKDITWEERVETCMFSAEIKPGETKKYILDVILPTNNYGGQLNILRADTKKMLEPVEETPLPVFDKVSQWKDVFFNGEEYMKIEDGDLYVCENNSWAKMLLPKATDDVFFKNDYKLDMIKTDTGYAARYCGWDRYGWYIADKTSKNKLYILDESLRLIATKEFPDYIYDFSYDGGELYVRSDAIYKADKNLNFNKTDEPLPKTNGRYTIVEAEGKVYVKNTDGKSILIEFESDNPQDIVATKDLFYYKKSSKYYVNSIWMDNILSVSSDGVNWTDIKLPDTYLELLKVYKSGDTIYVDTKYEQLEYELPEEPVVRVQLNDKLLGFETKPEISKDRTMVPLRFFFENLDAEVGWDNEKREITVKKDGRNIVMAIDSKTAYVDGKETIIDAAPYIKNERTMIPIRFLSENLGFSVEWDPETYSAYVKTQ